MKDPCEFTIPDWVYDSIFYQIFPDRFNNGDASNDPPRIEPWGNPPTRDNFFGGDLKGIIFKLDYLQNLGVNALYLTPIFKAYSNHKYDTTDYFKIDPSFGDIGILKDLVHEMHNRRMHIILDGVFNHCGEKFWAFEDIKEFGNDSIYKDWFNIRSYPLCTNPLNYYTCGGCSYLPKFNHNNPKVKKYIFKIASYWLAETGIDGWRLDTPVKVPMQLWKDFRKVVKRINPQSYLVGEIWREAHPWVLGDTFDGTTNYRLRELIIDFFSLETLDAEDFSYEIDSLLHLLGDASYGMLNLLGCHDTPRILSIFQGAVDRLLIAIVFLFSFIGIPLIYYGDEVGMVGGMDPDCRRTMVWDEGLWDKKINISFKEMIGLRNSHVALRRGSFQKLFTFNKVFAFKREYENDEVIIILNPGSSEFEISIPAFTTNSRWKNYFTAKEIIVKNNFLNFDRINAFSYLVLVKED